MSDAISNAVASAGSPRTSGTSGPTPRSRLPIDRFRILKERRAEAVPHKQKCLSDQETLVGNEKSFESVKSATYSTNMQKYIKIVSEAKKNAAKRKSLSKANILKGKKLFAYPIEKKVPQLPEVAQPLEKVEPHREPKLPLKR
jgi:hypothetical protein